MRSRKELKENLEKPEEVKQMLSDALYYLGEETQYSRIVTILLICSFAVNIYLGVNNV